MLKSFSVNNFKNFKDNICIDFSNIKGYQFSNDCISKDFISKMIIYGKNATGKTNFGHAICDIGYTLISSDSFNNNSMIKNANSNSDKTTFKYNFLFNNKRDSVIYEYTKINKNKIIKELLSINDVPVFECDFETNHLYFHDNSVLNFEILKNHFLNQMYNKNTISFLKWLVNNTILDDNSIYKKIYNFAGSIVHINNPVSSNSYYARTVDMDDLECCLTDLENFLNLMDIKCKLSIEKLPDGNKELYFLYDYNKIPFLPNASSGTISLFTFYIRFIMPNRLCSILFFDEFDAFFHYELSEKVMAYLKEKYQDALVIFTTHNTNLMTNKLMRPDCLFILSKDGRLKSLCEATEREIREGHNLSKLYMNGEFND